MNDLQNNFDLNHFHYQTLKFEPMWKEENNSLIQEFKFKNFVEAFSFMTKVALLAEKQNHHPTMINTYNLVKVELSTHDKGNTISEKDYVLAKAIDAI